MKKNRIARAPRAKTVKPAKGRLALFSNHVDVQWGACEIQVRLSQTSIASTQPPTVDVTEVVRVALPVHAAKVLAFNLLCGIAHYEALLGPVHVIPQLAPTMPSPQVLGPDAIARLAVLHAELFPQPSAPAAPLPPIEDENQGQKPKVTTH